MEESTKAEFKRFLSDLRMPSDGKMMSQGQRVAVKDIISIVQMLKYSAENMSETTVGAVLTRVGRLVALKELGTHNATKEELAKSCFRSLSTKGWGLFVTEPNREGGQVILKNSAIADEYPTKGLKVDYIAVGMISTIYEKSFGGRYIVKEVECVAKGDEMCKFTVKPLG
ncbi:MAG: 4-vinyl reductase [Candidatus Atabeyarchaeum deiterrae]|jgi:predicted hydrocarbon binding protein